MSSTNKPADRFSKHSADKLKPLSGHTAITSLSLLAATFRTLADLPLRVDDEDIMQKHKIAAEENKPWAELKTPLAQSKAGALAVSCQQGAAACDRDDMAQAQLASFLEKAATALQSYHEYDPVHVLNGQETAPYQAQETLKKLALAVATSELAFELVPELRRLQIEYFGKTQIPEIKPLADRVTSIFQVETGTDRPIYISRQMVRTEMGPPFVPSIRQCKNIRENPTESLSEDNKHLRILEQMEKGEGLVYNQ